MAVCRLLLVVGGLAPFCPLPAQRTPPRVPVDTVRPPTRDSARATSLATVIVSPGQSRVGGLTLADAPGVTTLSRDALDRRPQPLDDLFRSLGRLPGTVGTDQSARVAVRGAAPAQTGVMMDGMLLADPFHVKDFDGGLSVIPVDILDGITMLAGGLPVEYGDHLGGMLLLEPSRIRPRVTGRERPDFSLTAGLTGLRATAQHALDTTVTEWLVTGRRGWVDAAVHAAGGDGEVRPLFSDAYARVTRWLGPSTRLTMHGLTALDDFQLKVGGAPSLRSRSTDETLWATLAQSTERSRSMLTLGFDHRLIRRDAQGVSRPFDKTSLHDDRVTQALTFRAITEWEPRATLLVRTGAELWTGRQIASTGMYLTGKPTTVPRIAGRGTHAAVWIATRQALASRVWMEAGVRGERWDWLSGTLIQPRVALAWTPARGGGGTTLRVASSVLAEGMPYDGRALADGDLTWGRATRALQHAVSVGQRVGRTQWQLEFYQRQEWLDRTRWINASGGLTPAPELEPDRLRTLLREGQLRGVELSAHRETATVQWSAALVHAIARDRVDIGTTALGVWLPRPWDVRDAVTVDVALSLGATWSLALGYLWHSGWPVSQAAVQEMSGQLPRLVWPVVFGTRTPEYHRLDLRLAHRVTLGSLSGQIYVDAFNALNATNVRGINESIAGTVGARTIKRTWEPLLPRLPSAGVSLAF